MWPRAEPLLFEKGSPGRTAFSVRLSQMNFCLDTHFYPLGFSTMKYNPKVNGAGARNQVLSAGRWPSLIYER